MLTIPEEELKPKLDEHFGSIGRIVKDQNGDSTGNILWFLANSEEEFEKARANPDNFKTIRIKRMSELSKTLRQRQQEKPPGSTTLIEIPEVTVKEFQGYSYHQVDRSPKILELNTPHFRSVSHAIHHLRNSNKTKAWIYKGGSEAPKRDWDNLRRYNGNIPGIYRPGYSKRACDILQELVPDSLHVVRDGKDITQMAIDNGKGTIPLLGGLGLRAASEKGMGTTAVTLVKLTPENFRRAVQAAQNRVVEKKTGGQGSRPLVYKYDLYRLLHSIFAEVKSAMEDSVQCIKSYRRPYLEITACDGTTQDIIYVLSPAFEMIEKIKGLEEKLWKDVNYNETKGFAYYLLDIWKNRECLYAWQKSGKFEGLKLLIEYIEKYGKRCNRMKVANDKKKVAAKAAKAEKRKSKKKQHEPENTTKTQGCQEGGEEVEQPVQGPAGEESASERQLAGVEG